MTRAATIRAALFAIAVIVLWTFTPPELPVCGFHWITGRPCPLCGLTRAVFALAKGNLGAALRYHPLSPLAAFMLAGVLWNAPRMARLWIPCIALFAVYGVFRIAAF